MINLLKNSPLLMAGAIASLLVGTGWVGVALKTQAQDSISQEQNTARKIVAKMTEGQRTYYQKNGKFNTVVKEIAQDFDIILPSTFNYAIRTSFEAAYIYVIPAKTPVSEQLKAYVGGAFINQNQNPKIITIICESTNPGRIRPASPQVVRAKDLSQSTKMALQCGDSSVQVPDSQVKELGRKSAAF